MQGNIARKMAALNITGQAKSDILADIFGDRKWNQRGLIDSEEEFDAKVFSLKKSWDKAEKNCSRCDQPEFFTYFLVHISSDMKSKMLLPIRRASGLGDKFYFNNSTESINGSLKKEIEKQKLRANPGDPSKCSYTEFIEIAQQFVDKYQRNVHRAVKGDGPYRLAPEFQHLEIDEDTWRDLSPAEKIAKIAMVDKAGANKLGETQTTTIDENQSLESLSQSQKLASLPSFEYSGLPPLFRACWKNADTILKKNGVTKVAGAVSTYVVISLSNPSQPHIVNNTKKAVNCNCEGFKERKICAHSLAVSHVAGILEKTVSRWTPNLSNLVQNTIPKKSGKKPGPQRYRASHTAQERDIHSLDDRHDGVVPFPTLEPFRLTWLEGSRITSCYGCGNKIRATMHHPVPPEPYDIVIGRKQIRAYTPQGSTGLRFSAKPENVYFHLKKSCVAKQCSDPVSKDSLIVSDDQKSKLKFSHRNMLRKEFGIDV